MSPSTLPTAWITVREGALLARVGARLIYREIAAGRLRASRIGGRRELRTKPEWIDQWLERSAPEVRVA
jgi:excisionase family DNA binding protein